MSSLSERRLRAAFVTAHLDLLFLRFSVHCSSTASLDILFHHRIYIFTLVAVAVCKTCLFVLHTYCDASTRSRTTQKIDFKIEADRNRIESSSFECALIHFIAFTLALRIRGFPHFYVSSTRSARIIRINQTKRNGYC